MNQANRFYKFIRKGEYDLVNISLIGFDPRTGQTYEAYHAEYTEALNALVERQRKGFRWWQWISKYRFALMIAALKSHEGMP